MVRLQGRVAVVTGAGRNIGRAICLTFAKEGADVAVNVRSKTEEGQAVVDEAKALGSRAILITGDVSKPDAVARIFDQVKQAFGRIDILVNNAAVRPHTHFLAMTEEEWLDVVGIGLNGPFYCCKAAAPVMVEQSSGCIINVAGLDAFTGAKNRAHVVAAKAGLHGLTKALARDLGEFGIRVNTVVPGLVDTTRPPEWYPNLAEQIASMLPQIPLGRLSTTQDVANACLFLASDEAAYLTGQAIHVNGGRYML